MAMSHETIVYGFIGIPGSIYSGSNYQEMQIRNQQILDHLPETDAYPCLTKSMFSITGADYLQGTFRLRIIHFGGSLKYLEGEDIPLWIAKLESLLKKLFWLDAVVHIQTEISGHYVYQYTADPGAVDFRAENPQPVTVWQRIITHDGEEVAC
jgi:hypothetical protein